MKLPKILYKYCSANRIDVLEGARIRFTPPQQLNDVFEMTPIIDFDPAMDATARDKLAAANNAPFLGTESTAQHEQQKLVAATLDCVLSLCLAEAWDNPLMWSYYTCGHRGFVVGFDTLNDDLFPEPPRRVSYSRTRPKIGYDKPFDDAVYTKAHYWKHECEWRAVRVLECPDPIHLVPFQPRAVKEVILGNRISDSEANRILSILRDERYRHVQLYKLLPHQTEWSLQRTKIN